MKAKDMKQYRLSEKDIIDFWNAARNDDRLFSAKTLDDISKGIVFTTDPEDNEDIELFVEKFLEQHETGFKCPDCPVEFKAVDGELVIVCDGVDYRANL